MLLAVLVLDPWGQEIASRFGFGNDVTRYLDVMKAVPESFADVAGWQAAVDADGENVAALRSLGEAYFQMGLIAASNKFYERATRTRAAHQDPKLMSELHLAQAWGYLRVNDHLDARRTFRRALRNPRLERRDVALFGLVVASMRLDDRSLAVRYPGQLESEFPGSPALHKARAQVAGRRHSAQVSQASEAASANPFHDSDGQIHGGWRQPHHGIQYGDRDGDISR